jgi:hypothetical protein
MRVENQIHSIALHHKNRPLSLYYSSILSQDQIHLSLLDSRGRMIGLEARERCLYIVMGSSSYFGSYINGSIWIARHLVVLELMWRYRFIMSILF